MAFKSEIDIVLDRRVPIKLGSKDRSEIDASLRRWNSLSKAEQERENELLRKISESSGSGGP